MISKNRAKYIISLQQKKVRDEERLYVIEGDKLVTEFLQSGIHIKMLIAKPEFISSLSSDMKQYADIFAFYCRVRVIYNRFFAYVP